MISLPILKKDDFSWTYNWGLKKNFTKNVKPVELKNLKYYSFVNDLWFISVDILSDEELHEFTKAVDGTDFYDFGSKYDLRKVMEKLKVLKLECCKHTTLGIQLWHDLAKAEVIKEYPEWAKEKGLN